MDIQICPECTYVNEHKLNTCSMCQYEFFVDLEEMKRKRITENIDMAYNIIPESLFPSSCLFLTCIINGKSFKALIDTGAQISIMDKSIAEECHILDIIDESYNIKLSGVGEATSIGRIYCVDNMIEDDAIPMSFVIVNKSMGSSTVIIGMDILCSHRSIVDIFNKTITFSEKKFKLESINNL